MKHLVCSAIVCLLLFSCSKENEGALFSYIDADESNINFENTIVENDSINVINFQYIYNGGGVGIGDFNNDGLSDIVFTGNQVTSKIYLNQGNLTFKDISIEAKFNTTSWVTGVSIIDVNADGWDDIYLSVGGPNCNNDCENLLFVNQGLNKEGIPTFIEQAKDYNLNDGNYSQQAVFFDYDNDGDLDVYIAHNGNVKFDKNSPVPKNYMPESLSDYLLRNDKVEGKNHPVYTNVSNSLGITHKGFGLGVTIQDFNNDNLPDIYVSNDFITEDLLYINKGTNPSTKAHNGFNEVNKKVFNHLTYNAMGVDVADINNDTKPDVLVVDMLPENYERQKRMLGSMNYDKYLLATNNDYATQNMHNTLQINNGSINDSILKMSEVAFQSGMSATDWSWAPLMADFDNDGDKDVYITNGYVKDITDLDFITYSTQNTIFGSEEAKNKQLNDVIKKAKGVHLPNYFYQNNNALKFKDVSTTWIPAKDSYSNGAAYADLDNDGDLDLVVNNINEKAFVIRNDAEKNKSNLFLRIKLKGNKENKNAIGSKITLWSNGKPQQQYQSVIRGYLSSVEPIIHFGLTNKKIDSLTIVWPNNQVTKKYNLKANTVVTLDIKSGGKASAIQKTKAKIFQDQSAILPYKHQENPGHDYVNQHLLMRQYCMFGPCVAAANIDGKLGDELFVGGSKGQPSQIWAQNSKGVFEVIQKLEAEYEDTDAVFVDIDNDNDLDLYVSSGGTEFPKGATMLQDRIYLNNGKEHFEKAVNKLPQIYEISSCVRPNDFDKDGDIDFFVGSRIVTGRYPETPKSQLLINNGGKFQNKNDQSIQNLGMVTDAVWTDINKDGWDDLVVVGEWMPITIFINKKGKLEKLNASFQDKQGNSVLTSGWWNTIAAGDFDNDGDIDFIAGNQGENGFVLPQKNQPVYVYNQDFDKNGSIDPIVGQYFKGELKVVHTRDDVMKQLPKLKDNYLTYESFSKVDFKTLLGIQNLEKETLQAQTFSSSYIENLGNGKFKITALPEQCQVAPINDILLKDIDGDSYIDALLVGNNSSNETIYGKTDALTGIYLKGGKKGFKVVQSEQSGFYVPEQSHHIIQLKSNKGKDLILSSQTSNKVKIFSINLK